MAVDLVGSGIRSIRNVARDLRPSLLDDLGLRPALQALAHDFEAKTGIKTVLVAPGDLPALSPEQELALFRTMQEGLSNVARHSGASVASVTLAQRDGVVQLSVRDDGHGLAGGDSAEEQLRSRTGVLGMRERVAPLGGTVELSDPDGGGAQLVIRLPVAAPPGSPQRKGAAMPTTQGSEENRNE
jgi:two-component system sensor histidine kinase UhpB